MTIALAELNSMAPELAAQYLRACCGASRWVEAMVARRPYESRAALLAAGSEIWRNLAAADWEEAFAQHPRIGERASGGDPVADRWSSGEQSTAATADAATHAAMIEANNRYERRFGRKYIVCATGRGTPDLLADLETRMTNDPERERAVAAEEHRKITRLRLEKLILP